MEQFDNLDKYGALISMCHPRVDAENKHSKSNYVYGREFQAMLDRLDEEDCSDEAKQSTEKKRRLTFEQVKALERSFDVDSKLEPERKAKLAQELGLQPRQVAIWFQNRRARWKTKQLEKDYGLLKANYEALKLDFDNLEQEKECLTKELRHLKEKLGEENGEGNQDRKEDFPESSACIKSQQSKIHEQCSNGNSNGVFLEEKDESAQLLFSQTDSSSLHINGSSSSSFPVMNWFQIPSKTYEHQFVKMEEQNLSSGDDSCNFFSVDQAPTLHWYLPHN